MFKAVPLQHAERMVREGKDSAWFYEQSAKAGMADPFRELVAALLQESSHSDCPQEVRKAMYALARPALENGMSHYGKRNQDNLKSILSQALLCIALDEPHGTSRGRDLAQVALDYSQFAENPETATSLGQSQAGLFAYSVDLFETALSSGLEPGTPEWFSVLYYHGNGHLQLALLDVEPVVHLRRAIRSFIRSREEGCAKWTEAWSDSLSLQAKAHGKLAELVTDRQESYDNKHLAKNLEERSVTERTMPAPMRPEDFSR